MSVKYKAAWLAFALIFLLAVIVWLPVSVWQRPLQQALPSHVTLKSVTGQWWRGQAQLQIEPYADPFHFDWRMVSWSTVFDWSLGHRYAQANGQFSAGLSELTWYFASANVDTRLLRRIRFLSNDLLVTGPPITLQNAWLTYNWRTHRFSKFTGQADWSGVIYSPFMPPSSPKQVSHWRALGSLQASQPTIELKTMSSRHTLLEATLSPSNEIELTVMPRFMEALGHDWSGNKQYPAFVMVYPLTTN